MLCRNYFRYIVSVIKFKLQNLDSQSQPGLIFNFFNTRQIFEGYCNIYKYHKPSDIFLQ